MNSFDGGSLDRLRYDGTAAQGPALLKAMLADFPEARIVATDGFSLAAVSATPLGYRDLVDFKVEPLPSRLGAIGARPDTSEPGHERISGHIF
ncbi:MAG: hypothetical protein M3Y32_12830 [Pseudomonadota bacterium]|nr:hypothetical protein [Pseudomonadota bacterium]